MTSACRLMHFLLLMHSHCTTKALAWHRWPSFWPMLSTCMELQFLSSLFRKAPLGLFHLPTLHSRLPQMQLLMGQSQEAPRSMLRRMPTRTRFDCIAACSSDCVLAELHLAWHSHWLHHMSTHIMHHQNQIQLHLGCACTCACAYACADSA